MFGDRMKEIQAVNAQRKEAISKGMSLEEGATATQRNEQIAICLPGMASRVKRAPTSATRSAPLAMTRNWTMVRMRKTTAPTTKLPPR